MNILVISHEYPPIGGGGANACYYLSREYVKLGHDVTVVTSSYKDLPDKEDREGVHIIRVKAKRTKEDKSTFMEMFSYLKSAYFYADKLCRNTKFDICQVYFGIPSGPIGFHLKKKYKIPYIVRFGGGDIPGAQKRFSAIYKILDPVIRQIWKNADALIANSEGLRDRARAYTDKYRIDIISNGVDSSFFTRKETDRRRDTKEILFVSRLIEGKGLQYIIPKMREVYEKADAHLTIVGDGPYRGELEAITAKYDVAEHVTFVGRRVGVELYNYYNQADIFILPSLSEGMPNVVLEAMSMGLPIVMTPCGGSKELIDNNGIVSSIDDFVSNMINLLCDSKLCEQYSENSVKRVKELFSWSQKAKDYLELMENARENK